MRAAVYACVFVCDDGNVFASRMCCVCMSPVSHCEMINLKISFCHCAVLNNRLNQGVLAMGKQAGRQPVRLVESAINNISKELSGYCI